MEQLKKLWPVVLILLVVAGGLIYYFVWRPMQIRKDCAVESGGGIFSQTYQACLTEKGL